MLKAITGEPVRPIFLSNKIKYRVIRKGDYWYPQWKKQLFWHTIYKTYRVRNPKWVFQLGEHYTRAICETEDEAWRHVEKHKREYSYEIKSDK